MLTAAPPGLTADQRRIVEWGDGPLVVIAGAGTGKTKVIVERVRWLLETKGAEAQADDPLLPEHFLVLTYNVKGRLSPRAHALVVEWASIHAEELHADWELARSSLPLKRIAPLR